MSKIRNLPETTTLDDNDLLYAVDESVGTNGGRKIKKSNLKTSIAPTAAPSSQFADQANFIGNSNSFSAADHLHNIPTGIPSNTGTVNSQGISSSFSKADHVHNTSIQNYSAMTTLDTTTISLTDTVVDSMTLTPTSGNYLCIFSCSSVNSANGVERCWFSFYVGGLQVSATERSLGTSGGAYSIVALSAAISVNGSETFEVRWRVVGGTQTARSRRLSLVRLG